jgi:hypothetical protein
MSNRNEFRRFAVITAASLAIVGGAVCTNFVRADDKGVGPEETKMVTDQMEKMKEDAANASDAEKMKKSMAKQMVMEHMARDLAKDPAFKAEVDAMMADPNMKKIHDDAKEMASTDAKEMKQDILDDKKAVKDLIHHAMMMEMMMEAGDAANGGGGMMDMGKKMMDKMDNK